MISLCVKAPLTVVLAGVVGCEVAVVLDDFVNNFVGFLELVHVQIAPEIQIRSLRPPHLYGHAPVRFALVIKGKPDHEARPRVVVDPPTDFIQGVVAVGRNVEEIIEGNDEVVGSVHGYTATGRGGNERLARIFAHKSRSVVHGVEHDENGGGSENL